MKFKGYNIFYISLIYAIVLFTFVRLINDSLTSTDYLEQTSLKFAYTDIITLIFCSYILFLLLFKWMNYCIKNRISIIKEYSMISVMAIISVVSDMNITRYICHYSFNWRDYPIAIITCSLLSSLFYSFFKNQIIKEEVERKNLQLQKIINDQYQTELKLLKAQYHPHFLFNVLNMVYFQIDENNNAPRHTIELLSDLLRYQLYNDGEKVKVSSEIEYLNKYMALWKLRSKESLNLQINFDKRLNDKKVYPLLFTPLIENAFKYVGGIYFIKISMNLQPDGNLSFVVENSIPEKEPIKRNNSSGIGIENLKRRLELLYPDNHELILSKGKGYFCAKLIIKLEN